METFHRPTAGTEILTDDWGGYNSLSKHSYMHSRTVL